LPENPDELLLQNLTNYSTVKSENKNKNLKAKQTTLSPRSSPPTAVKSLASHVAEPWVAQVPPVCWYLQSVNTCSPARWQCSNKKQNTLRAQTKRDVLRVQNTTDLLVLK
jgi:hypothetical protein